MTTLPFPSFDPPPEVTPKEAAAYQKGYDEGMAAGRQAMGLYIPILAEALRDLTPYQESYRKKLNEHMVSSLEIILRSLVIPLPVAGELVRARATELTTQLDKTPSLHITVADPQALKGHIPEFVTLNANNDMAPTDVHIAWGDDQATATSHQEELQNRLTSWLAETLELITTQQEESAS
jgi:hypothetical protein